MQYLCRILLSCLIPFALSALAGCADSDADEYHAYEPEVPSVEPVLDEGDPGATPVDPVAESVESGDEGELVADATTADDLPPEETIPAEAESPDEDSVTVDEPTDVTGTGFPSALPTVDEPREIKLLVPEKEFRTEGPDDAIRLTFEDLDLLKVLNMEPVPKNAPDYFPQWLKDLEGQRIRLRGYMRPDFGSENIRGFILARDTEACCYGPNTKSYHIIPTIMKDGTTTDYIHLRPFDVVGVFRIQVEELTGDDGELEVAFVYVIEDAEVIAN